MGNANFACHGTWSPDQLGVPTGLSKVNGRTAAARAGLGGGGGGGEREGLVDHTASQTSPSPALPLEWEGRGDRELMTSSNIFSTTETATERERVEDWRTAGSGPGEN